MCVATIIACTHKREAWSANIEFLRRSSNKAKVDRAEFPSKHKCVRSKASQTVIAMKKVMSDGHLLSM